MLVAHPMLAYLPALLLVTVPLLVSPRARAIYIIFGGLLVFQSSQQLDAKKMLFLLGAVVAFGAALFRSRRLIRTAAYHDLQPLFVASLAMFALIAVSLPVSYYYGTPQKDWLRDAAPYVLVAAAPLFALDAQSGMTTRSLRRLVAVAGLAGAASFATRWIANRGIANLHAEAIGLPTFLLGAALFAFGMAIVLEGRRGWLRWLVLTSFIFAMLVATGTRTTAVLLAAPLAIVLGTKERFGRRAARIAIAAPLAAFLVFLGTQGVVHLVSANQAQLSDRVKTLFSTGTSADRSYLDRVSQTKAAWRLFKEKPLLGTGAGYSINWRDSFGRPKSSPNIDSSLAYLSKFGLAGIVVIAILVVSLVSFLRRIRARTGGHTTTVQLGLIGYAGVIAALSLLSVPFEDKGMASGLLLLLALAVSEASDASREPALSLP